MADTDLVSDAIIAEAESAAETLAQVKAEIAKAVFGQDRVVELAPLSSAPSGVPPNNPLDREEPQQDRPTNKGALLLANEIWWGFCAGAPLILVT